MTSNYITIRSVNYHVWHLRIVYDPQISDAIEIDVQANAIEADVQAAGDTHLGSVVDELANPEFYARWRSGPRMVLL